MTTGIAGHDGRATLETIHELPRSKTVLRILLAEDNMVNQRLGLLLLDRLGYSADVATNGREVLEAIDRASYDVILMDIQMPEMDGLDATRHIRARTDAHQPRIVAMTASTLAQDQGACQAAGMDDFVAKPVRKEELAAALRRAEARVADPYTPQSAVDNNLVQDVAPTGTVDLAVLGSLLRTLGERAPIAEARLIDTYLGELPRLIAQLRGAVVIGDRQVLHRAAHTLKSSSANMGAARLSHLCARLEDHSRDTVPDDAGASTIAIVEECDSVIVAFTDRRQHLPT